MYVLLFVLELVVLFFSSKALINSISHLLFLLFKSRKVVIYILSFLFLPGTFIHELSHFLSAVFLGVGTGEFTVIPEIHGNEVKLGSVQIVRTDPIRRFIIGVAPFFVGIALIVAIVYFASTTVKFDAAYIKENIWFLLLGIYILFMISNTMFSSKRDMDGAVPVLGAIAGVVAVLFYWGLSVPASVIDFVNTLAYNGCLLLIVPLALNIIFNGIAYLLLKR